MRDTTSKASSPCSRPYDRLAPVARLGQGSRTRNTAAGSFGATSTVTPVAREMDSAQPVAPVPLATISPDED